MEDSSSDIVKSDLESVRDSDNNDSWVEFDNSCLSSLSSSSSTLSTNSSLLLPSQNSTTPSSQSLQDSFTSYRNHEHNDASDKDADMGRIKDFENKIDSVLEKVNTDDAKEDFNLREMIDLFGAGQRNKQKQENQLVKKILLNNLKHLENNNLSIKKSRFKELSTVKEKTEKLDTTLRVLNTPVTDSSKDDTATATTFSSFCRIRIT